VQAFVGCQAKFKRDQLDKCALLLLVAENRTYHFQGEDTPDMET